MMDAIQKKLLEEVADPTDGTADGEGEGEKAKATGGSVTDDEAKELLSGLQGCLQAVLGDMAAAKVKKVAETPDGQWTCVHVEVDASPAEKKAVKKPAAPEPAKETVPKGTTTKKVGIKPKKTTKASGVRMVAIPEEVLRKILRTAGILPFKPKGKAKSKTSPTTAEKKSGTK